MLWGHPTNCTHAISFKGIGEIHVGTQCGSDMVSFGCGICIQYSMTVEAVRSAMKCEDPPHHHYLTLVLEVITAIAGSAYEC